MKFYFTFAVIRLTKTYRAIVMLRPAVDSTVVDDDEEIGLSLKALAGAVCVCRNRIRTGLELFESKNRG